MRKHFEQPVTYLVLWVVGVPLFVTLVTLCLLALPFNEWIPQGFLVASVVAFGFTSPFALVYFGVWGIMKGAKQRKSETEKVFGTRNLFSGIGALTAVGLLIISGGLRFSVPAITTQSTRLEALPALTPKPIKSPSSSRAPNTTSNAAPGVKQ